MKKLFAVLTALLVCAAVFAAGGKDGAKTAEPAGGKTKFTVLFLKNEWHGDPANMEVFRKLNEMANVEVEWLVYDNATWNDKKNLLITSGTLPDVFYMNSVNKNDIIKYAPQGMFIDLTDLIPKYAPRVQKAFTDMPNYKAINVDADTGKIYSVGRAAERSVQYTQAIHYINKKWLDKLGLPVPKTTDEFYAALKAFKEKDPNGNGKADEIPFSFSNVKIDFTFEQLFGAFGYVALPGTPNAIETFLKDEKGNIVFYAGKPEYREAVRYFRRMFAEGLFDKEGFTAPDTSVLTAKGNNPADILGSFTAFDSSFILPAEKLKDFVVLPPLIGPTGKQIALNYATSNGNINGTQFAVTRNAKGKEEAIMRWLDAHFDPAMSVQLFLGAENSTLKKDANGMFTYIPTPAGKSYSEFRYANAPVHVPCIIKAADWGTLVEVMAEDKNKLEIAKKYYTPYQTQSSLFLLPNAEENKFLLTTGKDIEEYVKKTRVKWLTEGGIDAEWDAYLKELDKLGVAKYQSIIEGIVKRMSK